MTITKIAHAQSVAWNEALTEKNPLFPFPRAPKGSGCVYFVVVLLCFFFILRTKNVVRRKEWAAGRPDSWLLPNEHAAPGAAAAFQREKALAALCSALTFSSSATQPALWYLAFSPVLSSLTQE